MAHDAPAQLIIRPATLSEIIGLRTEVIIQGTGRTTSEFPGDRNVSTLHLGAFLSEMTVGCATFLESEWECEPAWQLRGMATAPDFRRLGIGARVLHEAEEILAGRAPVRIFWCNARAVAIPFYTRLGWQIASDEFVTPGIGIQRKMTKRFDSD